MNDTSSPAPKGIAVDSQGDVRPVARWFRWLSVVLSIPVLLLCVLGPIVRGEAVYRFLLTFRAEYMQQGLWTAVVVCRWIAWLTLPVAGAQLVALILVLFRPRRRIIIASYIGLAALVILFVVWGYYMLPSTALMDATRRPAGIAPSHGG